MLRVLPYPSTRTPAPLFLGWFGENWLFVVLWTLIEGGIRAQQGAPMLCSTCVLEPAPRPQSSKSSMPMMPIVEVRLGLFGRLSKRKSLWLTNSDFDSTSLHVPFIFRRLGVRVVTGTDVAILKMPICGSQDFADEFLHGAWRTIEELGAAIRHLPRKHVAFHLLRQTLSYGRKKVLGAHFSELSVGDPPTRPKRMFRSYLGTFLESCSVDPSYP